MTDHDFIARALPLAARRLEEQVEVPKGLDLRERHFKSAMRWALSEVGARVYPYEKTFHLPDWPSAKGASLGGVDIVTLDPATDAPRHLIELKWCYEDKLYEALWDMYKMVLGSRLEDIQTAYVIVGAPSAHWEKPVACADLFSHGEWSTSELFMRYRTQWAWLLKGGTSRPRRLPARLVTELVGEAPLTLDGSSWSLRALAVSSAGAGWIDFENGWPIAVSNHALPQLGEGPITADMAQAILRFLPIFESPEFSLGEARGGKPDAEGVIEWPWFDYTPEVVDFEQCLYDLGWVIEFDWPSWQREAEAMIENRGVERAEPETLRRLLTLIVRKERFADGFLAWAFESGLIVRILKRLQALAQADRLESGDLKRN